MKKLKAIFTRKSQAIKSSDDVSLPAASNLSDEQPEPSEEETLSQGLDPSLRPA